LVVGKGGTEIAELDMYAHQNDLSFKVGKLDIWR